MTPERFLLTGCASGIGRHLADGLARAGHRVLATDVRLEALQAHAREARWPSQRVRCEALDVRDPRAWERLAAIAVDDWQGLDVVMNVAGIIQPGRVAEIRDGDVDRHFDVNLKGVVFGTRTAARLMIEQGHGHIVNVASLASLAPVPGISLYVASKYGVRGFSLAAAEELRPHGVAVTTVCPDAVRTPMFDHQLDYPEAAITFTAPRVLAVDEVSELILGKVLRRRPRLVSIPRSRALLARLADLFPSIASFLASRLERQGLRQQEVWRKKIKG